MEKLLFGLGVTGLGMIVVFAGLTILIGFILLLGKLAGSHSENQKKKLDEPVISTPTPAEEAAPADDEIPAEVIAAITAAIASVWEGQNGFVVRRVKRVHNAPAWSRAGREEQSYSHI